MHKIIRIIVYADSDKEALSRAKRIFEDNLVGEHYGQFDYGTFFDEKGSSVSGKGRWGNVPSVLLAESVEGERLIDEGMKFTKDSFLEDIKKAREIIDRYSDEELFEEKIIGVKGQILDALDEDKDNRSRDLNMFKYYCGNLQCLKPDSVYLFDDDGEVIDKTDQLERTLNKYGEQDGKKVYVVPVDVHY